MKQKGYINALTEEQRSTLTAQLSKSYHYIQPKTDFINDGVTIKVTFC